MIVHAFQRRSTQTMLRATWLVNSVRWDPIKLWGLEKRAGVKSHNFPSFTGSVRSRRRLSETACRNIGSMQVAPLFACPSEDPHASCVLHLLACRQTGQENSYLPSGALLDGAYEFIATVQFSQRALTTCSRQAKINSDFPRKKGSKRPSSANLPAQSPTVALTNCPQAYATTL